VPPTVPPSTDPKPTLVVFLTVDQMRSDYIATRFRKELTGGLKRLVEGGAFYINGTHDHGITETAPGHSTTMSGRFPVHTGIIMNSQGVNTSDAPLIDAKGPGASPFRFQGTTLTDWLKKTDRRTRALSVSRKDRGAILPIGTSREQVYWFAGGKFTTSTYYTDNLPDWVRRFNARKLPEKTASTEWDLLRPVAQYTEPDSVPQESNGADFVFPHYAPDDSADAANTLAGFPMMDEVTLQFALAGLAELKLGSGPQTDVLNISLSTLDAVGHRFGPDSREVHDMVLRLDVALGAFIDSLYKVRDSSRIVFALTGDHGVAPLIGVKSADPSAGGVFVSLKQPYARFKQALAAARIDTGLVALDEGLLLIDPRLRRDNPLALDPAIAQFLEDARRVAGIQRADLLVDLAKADTTNDYVARRWLHMFEPGKTNVVAIATIAPWCYWQGVTYATHGTPHDYDSRVPVLLYGAGVSPGQRTEPARVVDLAPTLAQIVGTTPLEKIDGHVLTSAIKP
jgi:predicted AlkP superfamily pyrophosphatase or phosphodiesterase